MQTATLEEKGNDLIKLGDIHNDINNEYLSAVSLAGEAARSGVAAVKAAIRAGSLLNKARKAIGQDGWEKWRKDNCPKISQSTDSRWRRLADKSHVTDLRNAKSLRQAYLAVGILHESEKETKGIGTANVDIFVQLLKKFDRLDSVIEITANVNPEDMPHEKRVELLTKAQPMLTFCERVKAAEGV